MSESPNHNEKSTGVTEFYVESLGDYPLEVPGKSGHLVMTVKYRNHPNNLKGTHFDMDPHWYGDRFAVISSAAKSQAWYWVEDLDYSMTPNFPPRSNDTVLDRLLSAIEKNQKASGPE